MELPRSLSPLLALLACPVAARPRTPTDDSLREDAFGDRLQPLELPADNPSASGSHPGAGQPETVAMDL